MTVKTTAIVLAAGVGRRMGGAVKKQFLEINGLSAVAHSLIAFENSPIVDEIILVLAEEDTTTARQTFIEPHRIRKCAHIVGGGKERQDSVKNALNHVGDDVEIIVIHDAVRPFVTARMIDESVAAALKFGASAVGVPLKDTIKTIDANGFVQATPPRKNIWLAQTPQAFRRNVLMDAYQKAFADVFYATDDAALVKRIGARVQMVMGSYDNIKITTPEDIALAQIMAKEKR